MRTIQEIAKDIAKEWENVHYAAKPYLSAMFSLKDKWDRYGYDSAESICLYFLANARTFRGEKARALKLELKNHFKR